RPDWPTAMERVGTSPSTLTTAAVAAWLHRRLGVSERRLCRSVSPALMPASHVPSRNAPLQWALRRTRDRSFELRCLREDLLAGPDLHQWRMRHGNRMPARADDLREQLRQHEDRPEQLRRLWHALPVRRVLERLMRCGAGHL